MNLLSGLEKFGLKAEDTTNLFAEEKKEVVGEDGTKQEERSLVFSVFFPDEVRYSWNKMQIPIIMYKKESCFSGFSACGGLL